jgi:hypothetical protein
MTGIIEDKKILEDIDKEIKQITDSKQNDKSKSKNFRPIN